MTSFAALMPRYKLTTNDHLRYLHRHLEEPIGGVPVYGHGAFRFRNGLHDVSAWIIFRNELESKVIWQFRTADARIKLVSLYPDLG